MPGCNLLLILNIIFAISFHWSNSMIQIRLLYSEHHNTRFSGMAPFVLARAHKGSTEGRPWLLATNVFFTLRDRRAGNHFPPYSAIALPTILDLCSSGASLGLSLSRLSLQIKCKTLRCQTKEETIFNTILYQLLCDVLHLVKTLC